MTDDDILEALIKHDLLLALDRTHYLETPLYIPNILSDHVVIASKLIQ